MYNFAVRHGLRCALLTAIFESPFQFSKTCMHSTDIRIKCFPFFSSKRKREQRKKHMTCGCFFFCTIPVSKALVIETRENNIKITYKVITLQNKKNFSLFTKKLPTNHSHYLLTFFMCYGVHKTHEATFFTEKPNKMEINRIT